MNTDLIQKAKDLMREGNARRVRLLRPNGDTLLELSLTISVGIAAILILLAPMLTALAAIAALILRFRLEIERLHEPPERFRRDHDGRG